MTCCMHELFFSLSYFLVIALRLVFSSLQLKAKKGKLIAMVSCLPVHPCVIHYFHCSSSPILLDLSKPISYGASVGKVVHRLWDT